MPTQQPGTPKQPFSSQPNMNPGDEAPAGTPGTGEGLCPECSGRGRIGDRPCPACNGTGKIVQGIGGA
jgi:hypothetical protein